MMRVSSELAWCAVWGPRGRYVVVRGCAGETGSFVGAIENASYVAAVDFAQRIAETDTRSLHEQQTRQPYYRLLGPEGEYAGIKTKVTPWERMSRVATRRHRHDRTQGK
jgi:hypothetical protein